MLYYKLNVYKSIECLIKNSTFLVALSGSYYIFRDHFVTWNLETGLIKDRLRPEYKENFVLQSTQTATHSSSKENIKRPKGVFYKEKTGIKYLILLKNYIVKANSMQ